MADLEADNASPMIASDGVAKGRHWALWGVVLAALVVLAPSLWWGFMFDDYGHQTILQGVGEHPTMRPWALYDFGGVPPKNSPSWQTGAYPWWCAGDWNVRFFRPLTSVSLWLDHHLWPANPVGYHGTNLGSVKK